MRIKKDRNTYYCGSNYMYDTGSTGDGSRYFGICTGDYF